MGKLCAFFGHREIPADMEPMLRAQVIRAITEFGVTRFINGGYGEFDHLAARVVHSLKAEYPHIRNTLIHAYKPESDYVPRVFDGTYYPKELLDDLPDKWHIPCRNIWMADQCDLVIAYVNHADSRIYEPLDHVLSKKPIVNLGSYIPKEEVPFRRRKTNADA